MKSFLTSVVTCLFLCAAFSPAPSMAQQEGESFPIRLEEVPTPPPFDLSRTPATAQMPAIPPQPVEVLPTDEPSSLPEPADSSASASPAQSLTPGQDPPLDPAVKKFVDLPVDKSMANPSGGMWRGRNTLTPEQRDSFTIPITPAPAQGTAGTLSANTSAVSFSDVAFSYLKPGGKSRVKAVVTPLTLQLGNGKTLQLSGIDIPDLNPYQPGEIAMAAQQMLETLVTGKELSLYVSRSPNRGRTNRLGHLLAHAEIAADKSAPALWIQGALLEKGLARVRTSAENPEMAGQMLDLEAKARATGLGLWAKPDYAILAPGAAQDKIGTFQIVEGTVYDVATVRNTIYLNFGKNWRSDFSGGIPAGARVAFARLGLKPLEWQGKRVRLRGFVEERNGPYISLDSPGQIEILDAPDAEKASADSSLSKSGGTPSLRPKPMYSLRHIDIKAPDVPHAQTKTDNVPVPQKPLSPAPAEDTP